MTCAENSRTATAKIEKNNYDLILCDIRLGISAVWTCCGKPNPFIRIPL
ncbi:MAG: hypothetical protein R2874_01245 [Desulfobacterales bacterium]